MRRLAALLFAAALAILPASGAAASVATFAGQAVRVPASFVRSQSVNWAVDDAAKTITATVRIRLGSACTRGEMARATTQGPAAAARCKVTPEVVKAIADNVDKVWNQGLTVKCYRLVVKVDITVADTLDGAVAGSAQSPVDRAFVAIDQSPAGIRSWVSTTSDQDLPWSDQTPASRIVAINGATTPSTWGYPSRPNRNTYAHEVGHILGLDDAYEDYVSPDDGKTYSRPRAGAPEDLMSSSAQSIVTPYTVYTLARRAGIAEENLKCDYTVDREVPGGTITGTKCGGEDGQYVINSDVTNGGAHVRQTWTVTWSVDQQTGTFAYADTMHAESFGTVSDSTGKASGSADVLDQGNGTLKMTLKETSHTSKGTSKTAGKTFRAPEAPVPLVDYEFTWKPFVCPAG